MQPHADKVFTSLYLLKAPRGPSFSCVRFSPHGWLCWVHTSPFSDGQGPGCHPLDSWLPVPPTGRCLSSIWLLHAAVTNPESAPLLKTPVVKDKTEIGAGGLRGLRCYTYKICREKELPCAARRALKHTQPCVDPEPETRRAHAREGARRAPGPGGPPALP